MSKVEDKHTLLRLLIDNSNLLRSYGVKTMGLFGSFVHNKQITEKSDVDFLVDFYYKQKTFRNVMDLGYFLEDLTGRKVEIVTREGLSKFIGPYILNEVENVPLKRRCIFKAHRRST